MIDVNSIKTGMTLLIEGNIYQVVEFLHVKPGKGSAFMKTKLKNLRTGGTIERTFNTNVKFEKANIQRSSVQYLYNTGDIYYFMNMETYEQLELTAEQVGEDKFYLIENMMVDVVQYEGELLGLNFNFCSLKKFNTNLFWSADKDKYFNSSSTLFALKVFLS